MANVRRFGLTGFDGDTKLPWDQFRKWVVCFCVVKFDLELGQAMEMIYPQNVELTDKEKMNICYLAFPDSNSGCMGDTQFHFRIRSSPRSCYKVKKFIQNDVPPGCKVDPAHFYGFVYFRQVRDPTISRGYFQKSVVVITRLPYVNLFSKVIKIVAPGYFENGEIQLEVACQNVDQWPSPEAGFTLQLPLIGTILQVRVPSRKDKPGAVSSPDTPTNLPMMAASSSPTVVPSLREPDIYRSLQSVLQHVHLLWELVLTNEPIVVMAPSPTISSETVQALTSLIAPLHYCSDYRPFFTIHDSEFKEYTSRRQAPPPVILGVTNPFFAKTLQHWPHVVRVGEMTNLTIPSRTQGMVNPSTKKSLEAKPGIYTKYKAMLNKDKAILKKLSKGNHGKRPPEVQNAVLKRHLLELTQSFIIPLERYVASLMPLQRNISAWKLPPKPKAFDAEEFLKTVTLSGPQLTSGLKGNWQGLYRKFFKTPNFEGWLKNRQMEINQKLQMLHLQALCEADILSWTAGKEEVEIVDQLLQIKHKLETSALFDPPVNQDIKMKLQAHVDDIITTLPEDLQYVLRNS